MAQLPRFPWLPVTGAVVLVLLGVGFALRIPEGEEAGENKPVVLPPLQLSNLDPASAEVLMLEQIAAYDPSPMFLPAPVERLTVAPAAILPGAAGQQKEAGSPFAVLSETLVFQQGVAGIVFPTGVTAPVTPAEALRLPARKDIPTSLGRGDVQAARLPARLGRLEVIDAQGGEQVLALDLPAIAANGTAIPGLPVDVATGDWAPLELAVTVNSAGLVGGVSVAGVAVSEETGEFFRSYLAREVRIGDRLRPGFYTLKVGP